jgi:GT2 family glycosyltransferase
MNKVDLHLVSWNRPKMTELVVKTIVRNTDPEHYRLVVLDNGSDGDTPERLQQLHDAGLIDELILLKTNLGLEAARNCMLINTTTSEYFICVDNDCLPPPMEDKDWVERLVDLIEHYRDYAAIAARTDPMIGTGNIFEEADEHGDDIVDFPHPGGSLRIMRTQETLAVGGWGREEPGRGAEERFICGKLREAGHKTGFAVNIRCLHLYGGKETDRWGYPKDWEPSDTGHSDIWHPKFNQGDDMEEVEKYTGKGLADAYHSNS